MSGYIDLNYISKIQPRLQQFKKKRDYLFNFRCPVCGESKKSKTKARAYLYCQYYFERKKSPQTHYMFHNNSYLAL